MIKKSIVFFLSFFLLFIPYTVRAQEPGWEPPEKNGVYDVPGKQNLKVRVFVHEPRNTPFTTDTACVDGDSSSVVDPVGWKLPLGSWTYLLNTASVPSTVGSGNLSTIAGNAFSEWENTVKNKVNFIAGTTTIDKKGLDGKNIIAWGRTSGIALAVTYTWYNSKTKLAVETDTIINKKYDWGWAGYCDNTYYDAQNILTHELGHWIGLNDEYNSSYVDNTMYGYGSKGEIKKDTLTVGDIAGVDSLNY